MKTKSNYQKPTSKVFKIHVLRLLAGTTGDDDPVSPGEEGPGHSRGYRGDWDDE